MNALASNVIGEPAAYRPSDDEPFMNERQLAYFKHKLLAWRDDILRESKGTVINLKAETENHPDLVDRASSESDRALELRTRIEAETGVRIGSSDFTNVRALAERLGEAISTAIST